MSEANAFADALRQVLESSVELLSALFRLGQVFLVNCWALLLWVTYWLWLARWPDLRAQMRQGGWLALVLLSVLVSLIWGLNSGPSLGIPGLPSVAEKLLITAAWVTLAFVCGSVQDYLGWTPPEVEIAGPPEGEPAPADSGHGH